jgi:hypothetical protein
MLVIFAILIQHIEPLCWFWRPHDLLQLIVADLLLSLLLWLTEVQYGWPYFQSQTQGPR